MTEMTNKDKVKQQFLQKQVVIALKIPQHRPQPLPDHWIHLKKKK